MKYQGANDFVFKKSLSALAVPGAGAPAHLDGPHAVE